MTKKSIKILIFMKLEPAQNKEDYNDYSTIKIVMNFLFRLINRLIVAASS